MTDNPHAVKILVLFAHPALDKSRVHVRLLEAVRSTAGVTLHDLYEEYPRLEIDVQREQDLLLAHDLIIFQHPLYWWSTPAILKEWQDLVLEHGWAYGREGKQLHGKHLLQVLSSGGPDAAYGPENPPERPNIRQFLIPIERTAKLCGMEYWPPFCVHGTHRLDAAGAQRYADDYARVLAAIRDGKLTLQDVKDEFRLTDNLDTILPRESEAADRR